MTNVKRSEPAASPLVAHHSVPGAVQPPRAERTSAPDTATLAAGADALIERLSALETFAGSLTAQQLKSEFDSISAAKRQWQLQASRTLESLGSRSDDRTRAALEVLHAARARLLTSLSSFSSSKR